jgi:hypothetical protein
MTPRRLRRSVKFDKRLLLDIFLTAVSLSLIVGIGVLTIHRHPTTKLMAAAPSALQGSVTH